MNAEDNYQEINKNTWNSKVEYHLASDFYGQHDFLNGKSSLKPIELELLGNVSGKSVLHLQCHFGQDTISLARMGALATGADISDKAITAAQSAAVETGTNASFVCCDIYDLPNQLQQKFDIVFTSYGTIGWLPNLDKWARVISHFLKPGGKLVFAEFHPVVWMYDDDFEAVVYNYSNEAAIVESAPGTYADKDAPISGQTVNWNHGLAEVLTSLIGNGLSIDVFREYDYSPYACFNGLYEFEPGKFRIKKFGNKIPMVYALSATKND